MTTITTDAAPAAKAEPAAGKPAGKRAAAGRDPGNTAAKDKAATKAPPPAEADAAQPDLPLPDPDGEQVDPLLDRQQVEEIKDFEAQADHMVGKAEQFRAEAAKRIVKQLARPGVSERMVAAAIGKSPAHVHHCRSAWQKLQEDESIGGFNEAYRRAKAKKPDPEALDGDSAADDRDGEPARDAGGGENDRPPASWTRQVRELKALLDDMTGQVDYVQATQLSNLLEKDLRFLLRRRSELAKQRGAGSSAQEG